MMGPDEKRLGGRGDGREKYDLEAKAGSYNGRLLLLGAASGGRAYVSFHLIPLYWDASLLKGISPELQKRMQGKSSFNFTAPDPALFSELAKLDRKSVV